MIIFGTKAYLTTLARLTALCLGCRHTALHRVYDKTLKLTIFFIPLFAVSTTHLATCTACGRTTKMTAENHAALVEAAAAERAAPAG